MAGGFRLQVIGLRAYVEGLRGKPFVSPDKSAYKDILAGLDQQLMDEGRALRAALQAATPVYKQRPLDRGYYQDRGLKRGWRPVNSRSADGASASVDIVNSARAPALEGSLINLVARTGAQSHVVAARHKPLLVFPHQDGGLAKKVSVMVGFEPRDFVDRVISAREAELTTRLQKSAGRAILRWLEEER